MPSLTHELLVELIRRSPSLLASLLGLGGEGSLRASEVSAELNLLVPTEYRADGVWLLDGPSPLVAVLEVQLGPDADKPWVWPHYLTALRVRHRRPVVLLVLTLDHAVARWAARPLVLGPGSSVQPLVVGPDQIPWVRDPEEARRCPERAVLSVLAHGGSAEAAPLGWAVLNGLDSLDEERIKLYSELVWLALNPAARSVLEAMMTRNFELKGELLAILERRVAMEAVERGLAQGLERGRLQGLEQGLEQGLAQGLEQGLEQGLAQGLEQGLAQGLEQGLEQGRLQGQEQGRLQGQEFGRVEGERQVLRTQLTRRFGTLPPWAEERLERAARADLERWAEAILDAATLERALDG